MDGSHYARTAEAWLAQLDAQRATRSSRCSAARLRRAGRRGSGSLHWRIFFLACAELWGFRGGSEWGVSHYLLSGRRAG